jgi:hypothetical protein
MNVQVELTEEELEEASAAAMGHAAEREFVAQHQTTTNKKSKYHVKHKGTGKIVSTHASAPDAVRARAKLGPVGHQTHSIIKEDINLNEQVAELIQAMSTGKSLEIESAFNEVMSSKLIQAIDVRRTEIANNLFNSVQEDTVEEAVVPGSVKKDKDGNIVSAKTVPDVHHGKDNKPKTAPAKK